MKRGRWSLTTTLGSQVGGIALSALRKLLQHPRTNPLAQMTGSEMTLEHAYPVIVKRLCDRHISWKDGI